MRPRLACLIASPARSMSPKFAARQSADDRMPGELGDLRHRLEIAFGGDREARLDDVDAHVVEKLGDLQLFLERHRRAGALLAVAQRRVENDDLVFVALRLCRRIIGCGRHGSLSFAGRPALPGSPLYRSTLNSEAVKSPGHEPGRRPGVMRPRGR